MQQLAAVAHLPLPKQWWQELLRLSSIAHHEWADQVSEQHLHAYCATVAGSEQPFIEGAPMEHSHESIAIQPPCVSDHLPVSSAPPTPPSTVSVLKI